ncbi:MAG: hypothetical protein ACREV9_04740 [Burkholderiales bacterium]
MDCAMRRAVGAQSHVAHEHGDHRVQETSGRIRARIVSINMNDHD